MRYAILDNNRFYAQGLFYAIQRSSEQTSVTTYEMEWRHALLLMEVIVIRCRFSIMASHHVLIAMLLKLEAKEWQGRLYLLCNEKGWALAIYLRLRFPSLHIHILNDRLNLRDAACLLTKEPRRPRSCRADFGLTGTELAVLSLLIKGLPVRRVACVMQMTDKQVSTYKCNALKKLNASNLLQLLI